MRPPRSYPLAHAGREYPELIAVFGHRSARDVHAFGAQQRNDRVIGQHVLGRLGAEGVARIPEVIEIHSITGDADFLAKVVARDTEDLYRVTNGMLAVEGVIRTNTSISLVEAMPTRLRPLLETAVTAP